MGNCYSDEDKTVSNAVYEYNCTLCLSLEKKIKDLEDKITQLEMMIDLKETKINLLENQIYMLEKYN